MAKGKGKTKETKEQSATSEKGKGKKTPQKIATEPERPTNLAELRQDRGLWYKVCVLIHDLKNMAKDKASENRTLQTTDALYISTPYFTVDEAATVKAVVADMTSRTTVEEKITSSLENFFEKRKASGDARPCGPHDMVPVYLECFGVDKAEIEDEKFVSRVRRSGLN